ncbi:MAG: sel1 repeat family protein [Myxococcales bacterium]|nr:sel1 repeat family protein [Myxococcales bacterium]
MKTSAFLGLSALFLVACAGAPQRWGSAKPTTAQKPTPTETTVTSAAVSPTNEIAAACKGAGCVSACERTTDMDACREAGYALRDGSSPDFARAARMFDKACTKKDRRACHELGKAFSVGEGIPADANKAVALYGVACDQGLGQACEDLSKLHEKGEGVPQDHHQGRRTARPRLRCRRLPDVDVQRAQEDGDGEEGQARPEGHRRLEEGVRGERRHRLPRPRPHRLRFGDAQEEVVVARPTSRPGSTRRGVPFLYALTQ